MQRITADHEACRAISDKADFWQHYPIIWLHPDGRVSALHRLAYHWTVHVDLEWCGYRDRYCYDHAADAIQAFDEWDGETGDPRGWKRHPLTGRRRLPVEEFDPRNNVSESPPVLVDDGKTVEWVMY